jgi:hypothetical protein
MNDRREDWTRGVDENLASLNASQRVWDRELIVIRKLLGEFDSLLRGNTEKETDGMIARLHHQENDINRLKAIIQTDASGGKGVLMRLYDLERGDQKAERRLKIWLAIISVVSVGIGGLIANFDRLAAYYKRPEPPVEQAIEKAKHPKGSKRVVYRIVPPPEDTE